VLSGQQIAAQLSAAIGQSNLAGQQKKFQQLLRARGATSSCLFATHFFLFANWRTLFFVRRGGSASPEDDG
jgi:hypothetical protein